MSDERKRSGLTYSQHVRITKEVVLGIIPPADESLEAAQCRADVTREFLELRERGLMLTLPTDWDADDEGAKVEELEPDNGGGGIPCGDSFIAPDKECRFGEGEPSAGLGTSPAALGPAPLPAPVPEGHHPSAQNSSLSDA